MMAKGTHAMLFVAVALLTGCGSRTPQESRAPQKPYFVAIVAFRDGQLQHHMVMRMAITPSLKASARLLVLGRCPARLS